MYLEGNGVPQDYVKAAKWFQTAAERGDLSARCALGTIYAEGKGMAQDYVQAHMWLGLCISAARGKQQIIGAKILDQIAEKMTPAQIQEAERLARQWK
jgi:TPR repeat protein